MVNEDESAMQASDVMGQSNNSAGFESDRVPEYRGRIVINLPIQPLILHQFDSQLDEELKCPLTGKVFTQPVVAADGYTYEYSAIKDHIESQIERCVTPTSPLNRGPFGHLTLVPNNLCARTINERLDFFNVSRTTDNESELAQVQEPQTKRVRLA